MKSQYKHWINLSQNGEAAFVTSTCLDFAPLFERDEMKTKLMRILANDCKYYNALLFSFVIMQNHIHLIVQPNENMNISILMQRIKTNSSKALLPFLNHKERDYLSMQQRLNNRKLWKLSFRSVPIVDDKMFLEKAEYIHNNPVRAGIVEKPEDYYWSSARFYSEGLMFFEKGVADLILSDH